MWICIWVVHTVTQHANIARHITKLQINTPDLSSELSAQMQPQNPVSKQSSRPSVSPPTPLELPSPRISVPFSADLRGSADQWSGKR